MNLEQAPGARAGFTFFEIAISLALAAFCILTVMALIPSSMKMQQKARFALLAATKNLEIIEFFNGKPSEERIADFECPEPWEARPWCYSGTRWDLECRACRLDSGIMPVPLDIAQRLDSDNDEIHSLLSQGAYLFYADPRTIPAVDERFINPSPPDEGQKLVFAVTGYAQDNAIPIFSYKSWPYRAGYPSPPMVQMLDTSVFFPPINYNAANGNLVAFESWTNGLPDAMPPTAHDPLMDALCAASIPYQTTFAGTVPQNNRVQALQPYQGILQTAVFNYITDKFNHGHITNPMGSLPISGLSAHDEYTTYYLAPGISNFQTLGSAYDADFYALCQMAEPNPGETYASQSASGKAKLRAELGLRVQCMRFMSMIMSTYNIYLNGTDQALVDFSQIPAQYQPFSPDLLSADRLRYYRDRAQHFSMRYAASFTYDWGAPRPITRSIMTDYPLFEYDMFSPPHTGTISGTGGMAAAQWCPISAQTITSIGLPSLYPGAFQGPVFNNTSSPFVPFDGTTRKPAPPNIWGDASHFTLTRPFAAAERCRQLVFWSVDWQSYEDAETAPSAPLDASRCPLDAPNAVNIQQPYTNRLNNGIYVEDGLFLRNPERTLNFRLPISGLANGTDATPYMEMGELYDTIGVAALPVLNGIYGADRNHNYLIDRGPTKKDQRLHASLVARFNFYDPRLPVTLR